MCRAEGPHRTGSSLGLAKPSPALLRGRELLVFLCWFLEEFSFLYLALVDFNFMSPLGSCELL